MKKKTIKAFLIGDGKHKPLVLNNIGGKTLEALALVYLNKREAEKAWRGFNIMPCTITYQLVPRE